MTTERHSGVGPRDGAAPGERGRPGGQDPAGGGAAPSTVGSVLGSVLIAIQGLLILLAAVVYLVEALRSRASAMLNVGMSVLLFVAAGAGLLAVARGVRGRRRWARAPAVTWELVCLPVAYGLVQSGRWYLGLPLALMALLALVAVVASPPAD